MVLVIGEVLVDEFPGYSRIGGAPFNFAVHLHRFGLPVRFISRVGDDDYGKQILDFASAAGLSTEDIQVDQTRPTGRVKVELDEAGVPNFNIIGHTAYDRVETGHLSPLLESGVITMLYYGSLIQRTEQAFHRVSKLLTRGAGRIPCFCDINLREGCYNPDTIRSSVEHADILKLSDEEALEIAGILGLPRAAEPLTEALFGDFGVETVILTRGAEGSEWFSGDTHTRATPPPLDSVADTVGAGDAFAAAAAFGILKGSAPDTILRMASDFAARICGIEGAVPGDTTMYTEFLEAHGQQ